MAAGGNLRGKSGLPLARVPGNARRGQPQGKRHREETALLFEKVRPSAWQGDGETVGQEPTAGLATGPARQAPPGAMPNRGLARALVRWQQRIPPQGSFGPRDPGWQLDPVGNGGTRGMVIQGGNPWTESGLQALRAKSPPTARFSGRSARRRRMRRCGKFSPWCHGPLVIS